jgi:uncharacterized protein YoaH (UPF0181 family)
MPSNVVLRKRTARNSKSFDAKIDTLESQIEKLENQLKGVSGLQLQAPVRELQADWGIHARTVGNKIEYYKFDEKKKEVPYDPGTTKAPADLLARLNKEYEESGGKPGGPEKLTSIFAETEVPEAPPTKDAKVPSVGNISVPQEQQASVDAIKKLMAERLAAKKNATSEINEQKKEDDNNCPM